MAYTTIPYSGINNMERQTNQVNRNYPMTPQYRAPKSVPIYQSGGGGSNMPIYSMGNNSIRQNAQDEELQNRANVYANGLYDTHWNTLTSNLKSPQDIEKFAKNYGITRQVTSGLGQPNSPETDQMLLNRVKDTARNQFRSTNLMQDPTYNAILSGTHPSVGGIVARRQGLTPWDVQNNNAQATYNQGMSTAVPYATTTNANANMAIANGKQALDTANAGRITTLTPYDAEYRNQEGQNLKIKNGVLQQITPYEVQGAKADADLKTGMVVPKITGQNIQNANDLRYGHGGKPVQNPQNDKEDQSDLVLQRELEKEIASGNFKVPNSLKGEIDTERKSRVEAALAEIRARRAARASSSQTKPTTPLTPVGPEWSGSTVGTSRQMPPGMQGPILPYDVQQTQEAPQQIGVYPDSQRIVSPTMNRNFADERFNQILDAMNGKDTNSVRTLPLTTEQAQSIASAPVMLNKPATQPSQPVATTRPAPQQAATQPTAQPTQAQPQQWGNGDYQFGNDPAKWPGSKVDADGNIVLADGRILRKKK